MAKLFVRNTKHVEAMQFTGGQSAVEIAEWLGSVLYVHRGLDNVLRNVDEYDHKQNIRSDAPEFLLVKQYAESSGKSYGVRVDLHEWIIADQFSIQVLNPIDFVQRYSYSTVKKKVAVEGMYREITPAVEARQHDGTVESGKRIVDWVSTHYYASVLEAGTFNNDFATSYVAIQTRSGIRHMGAGDWLVRTYAEDFRFYKDDEFQLHYEKAEQ